MLAEIEVQSGAIWWRSDRRDVRLSGKHLFIFVPAFSWAMERYDKHTHLHLRALLSRRTFRNPTFTHPILFQSDQALPLSLAEVETFLEHVTVFKNISTSTNPSALSSRVKREIDFNYAAGVQIQAIAKKLKTQSAVLSRNFRSEFGETPSFYRKGLRVTVGMHELMMGRPPAEAAHLAGYSDLGRFYKQFRAYLKQTPAEYLIKSKNAKNTSRA